MKNKKTNQNRIARRFRYYALSLCVYLILAVSGIYAEAERIVSLNGSITEIIFALGSGDKVVGCDTSSFYPEKALSLPKIGYQRALSAEGILSLSPDLILGTDEAGPPTVLQQLEFTGKKALIQKTDYSLAGVVEKIQFVGKAIGKEKEAEKLTLEIEKQISKSGKEKSWKKLPVILFIYARGQGTVNVAGKETAGDEMIRQINAKNSITEFSGYKPINPESVFTNFPNLILIPSKSLESLGGEAGLWNLQGFNQIPVQKRVPIVQMDDLLLLGFSARFGEAVTSLKAKVKAVYKE